MSVIYDNTKLSNELNFRTLQSTRSSPQYRKVFPANGGSQTLVLKPSGTLVSNTFNIPAECVNLGESYLEYSYTIAANAGHYTWIYKDVHGEFDSLTYRDSGSMYVVDVKNLHLYNQITNRFNFSEKDLKYHDDINGLVPTNALLSDVKSVRFDNSTCSLAFIEPQQMACISGAAAISSVQYKKIYLKELLKDSYFGLAKNQILPVETYLDINFSSGNKVGFSSLSAVLPNSTPIVFTADLTISNIVLNLAVEQNQELVKMMKSEVEKGISLPIPWIKVHQSTMTAATSFVYNLPLDNKQHGQKLKRLIFAPLLPTLANQTYDHTNVDGTRVSIYQTELDNMKLQRDLINVSTTKSDDYSYHKKVLKNTLFFNKQIYNQNWFHIDSFDSMESNADHGQIMVDGLLLNKPMTWTVNVSTCSNSAFQNTAIVIGQKLLQISSTSFLVQ